MPSSSSSDQILIGDEPILLKPKREHYITSSRLPPLPTPEPDEPDDTTTDPAGAGSNAGLAAAAAAASSLSKKATGPEVARLDLDYKQSIEEYKLD
ncbi:hypothetical protein LTR17_016302 [Elasticomyces elasticus]|nr:hypothetical protein LTR17_016302 [Elasticomyces elasticus]